ncbi:hypothetical protein [Salinimicrobium gaetbulicola]|uniref:Uncharacterized protein n=1 Tax=Salinimicrobium gaetbulicola TaxID=999702 RepID=A0ABW3ICA7_9FLAO
MTLRKISIGTSLSIEEVSLKLKSVTSDLSISNIWNATEMKFEGKIEKNSFVIYPLFDYGFRKLLRPVLVGKITENKDNHNIIKITFKVPEIFKVLLAVAIVLPFVVSTGSIFWTHISFVFLGSFIYWLYLKFKINKSIKILNEILHLTNPSSAA